MRKSLWIAVLMTVLCVGLGVTGFVRLNESGKQVQFEETVLFGDKSAIDGLSVTHQLYTPIAENERYLYWDTAYRPAEGTAEAEYTYREEKLETPVENREFLNIGTYNSGGMQTSGTIDLREQGGVWAPVLIDVAERAGTELYYTESVDLRDYFEYYPLSIDVKLGTLQFYSGAVTWDSTMEEWMKILQEEFRILLTEKCYVKIEIFKRTNGGVYQYHISSEWSPSFSGRSLITEKYCYLLVDGKEKATDSSRVRQYWSIYRIPYEMVEEEGREKTVLHMEEMEKLLTVDSGISVHEIRYDEKRERIELIYTEHCGVEFSPCKLMVIDGKTGEIVQDMTLIDSGERVSIHVIYCQDEFKVITVREPLFDGEKKGFILLTRGEDGNYRIAFEGDFPKNETTNDEIWFNSTCPAGVDFDGERLVIGSIVADNYADIKRRKPGCFQIFVYEAGELTFHAQYKSSLVIGEDVDNGWKPCDRGTPPVRVSWD